MDTAIKSLGQAGYRFQFGETVVYIDPYLTNYVQEMDGEEMHRLVPIPFSPDEVVDADWVLISHGHIDHCDPTTLLPLSRASRTCRFVCPGEVGQILTRLGISEQRIFIAREEWLTLDGELHVRPIPAAHPDIERDSTGLLRYVGFVIEYQQCRMYHSGDTSLEQTILSILQELLPIEIAFLPVNEKNFYRAQRGIIGNMSVREAFQMATDIGVKTLVPMHWDMFSPNSVFPEEIDLLYRLIRPPFKLVMRPEGL
ncbi:MAG: MBL fold metallo-hydrolase [Gemmatimonadaceae bacterium]|nr:MBL fold metallo-hydrolase [Gloeobacterales cyanobacterium ES-bin-141]